MPRLVGERTNNGLVTLIVLLLLALLALFLLDHYGLVDLATGIGAMSFVGGKLCARAEI